MKANESKLQISDLITRVREKDQSAFPALLALYEPLVHAEVSRHAVGLPPADAEDLRQVALLAFYRAVLSFDLAQDEVKFGLYAKVCIANALVSQLRVINRCRAEVSDLDRNFGDSGEGDPARRLMEQEALESLLSRIRTLLSPYENKVWALYVAGHSAREIASALGKDPHSVENAVYRIRQKLKKGLGAAR